jgi:hypothetical protein
MCGETVPSKMDNKDGLYPNLHNPQRRSTMNIAIVFALICGVFVTAVLVLVFWLIMSGLKEARHNDRFTSGGPEPHNKSEV